MPEFTITISDRFLARLQAATATYNSNNGTNLTVKEWLVTWLKGVVTQEDLGQFVTKRQAEVQAQAEKHLNDEIEAERTRLLAEMD